MKSFFSNVSQAVYDTVLYRSMHRVRRPTSAHDDSSSQLKRKFEPEEEHYVSSSPSSFIYPTSISDEPPSKKAKIDSLDPVSVSPAVDHAEPTLQSEPRSSAIPHYPAYSSPLLNRLPSDVLQYALSYIASDPSERPSILRTCKMFHVLANSSESLRNVDLFKNHGRILFDFNSSSSYNQGLMLSPSKAVEKLLPFAKCGNVQALYMIGIIRTYCNDSYSQTFRSGIAILNHAAKLGDVHSSYTLGLILRDGCKTWSAHLLNSGCERKYLPSCQELMSAPEIKDRFGDLDADMLEKYMDPRGLSRLLKQFYFSSPELRVAHTSHCWNPLCGRWAFKASQAATLETNPVIVSTPSSSSIPQDFTRDSDGDTSNNSTTVVCLSTGKDSTSSVLLRPLPDVDSELDSILLQKKGDLYSSPFASTLFATPCEDPFVTTPSSGYLSPFHSGSMFAIKVSSEKNLNEEDEEDTLNMNRVSRMKMCSSCRRAKYCSKLCQVYDWRSGRHRTECNHLT